MAGTETSQGDDSAFPLDTRPAVEHTRVSAFEVYRKPHQGTIMKFMLTNGGSNYGGHEKGYSSLRHDLYVLIFDNLCLRREKPILCREEY